MNLDLWPLMTCANKICKYIVWKWHLKWTVKKWRMMEKVNKENMDLVGLVKWVRNRRKKIFWKYEESPSRHQSDHVRQCYWSSWSNWSAINDIEVFEEETNAIKRCYACFIYTYVLICIICLTWNQIEEKIILHEQTMMENVRISQKNIRFLNSNPMTVE